MLLAATKLDVGSISRFFRALGDETRMRIVALLTHGELCVCHVQAALDLTQPNTSRQLGLLRTAGVVEQRREGNWIYYRLARQEDPDCQRHLRELVEAFGKREVLRRDVEKLLKARGPGACR